MSARVCVVISVKDGERYLSEAIDSVLSQEGVDLELRLYDNGSSDGTIEIASSYLDDPRVFLTENPDGTEYWQSLDLALQETAATYFTPFACDDVMLPGNLAAKVGELERTNAVFAHSESYVIDGEGAVQRVWCDYANMPSLSESGEFLRYMAPVNPTVLMATVCRTAALREIGGFADSGLIYCADWLALLRLAMRGRVATIHRPLIGYRRHAESSTTNWHTSSTWVGELVDGLALALADPAAPPEWRVSAPALLAGCLDHCARELALHGVLRTDASGVSAYGCAARAAVLAPSEPRRATFEKLVAAAGLTPPARPFALAAAAPDSPADAERLLACCEGFVAAGLADGARIGCDAGEVERVAAPLRGPCEARPGLEVVLGPTPDGTTAAVPGSVVVCAAAERESIANAEAHGVPVLTYEIAGALAQPWDRALVAASPTLPPAETHVVPVPADPSPALRAFTAGFPWERSTILSFMQRVAAALPPGSRVLDVGAGEQPYRELFDHVEYVTTDWENSCHPGARRVDVVCPADEIPLPGASFDAVINTQVLEHVAEPSAVLFEFARLLRPGGRLFMTVPLVWELHEEPYDFFRYTPHGLRHLLRSAGFADVEVEPRNDCFSTLAQLLRNANEVMGRAPDGLDPDRERAARFLLATAEIVATFAPLDAKHIFPLGYSVVASMAA